MELSVNYYLYPPFFIVEPQTSFDKAWEVFCCELLNMSHCTNIIRRRNPPDLGADLIWESEGIVYQCKAVEDGQAGSLDLTKIKRSIDRAKENQKALGWHRYILCVNVDLTGSQEQKLREYLPCIEFLGSIYWTTLCKKFAEEVNYRFHTLTQENIALSGNTSLYLWHIPYHRNSFFTGREHVLHQIYTNLHSSSQGETSIQTIKGLGGIGKTQIALEYACRYRGEYSTVLWIQAATRHTLLADFMTIAEVLHLRKEPSREQERVVDEVKRWLAQHNNWLLIFDNADDLVMVFDFLPPAGDGHILLTTRDQAGANIIHSIEIEKLSKEEGVNLLLRRAKILAPTELLTSTSRENQVNAETIVAEMDGLPLALDQAGAYIEEMKCGLSHYIALYRQRSQDLLGRRSRLSRDYPESVATTWLLSFEQIKQSNPGALELLNFCAFFHPDSIPEELVATGKDPLQFDEMIGELLKFSLMQRNSDNGTLIIHRLVQAVLLERMDENTKAIWAEIAVRAVELMLPEEVKAATWPRFQRYLPHSLICADLIEQYHHEFVQAARLIYVTGYYLQEMARYKEAELLYQHALVLYKQVWGQSHPDVAATLHELGRLSHTLGMYKDAEEFYKQALNIHNNTLDIKSPNVATTHHEVGRLLLSLKRYKEAQYHLERALTMREQLLGSEHSDTAATLHELAVFHQRQGQNREAQQILQRVLSIEEKILGSEHPDTAITLHSLGGVYLDTGQTKQAQAVLERALSIHEKILGPEHPVLTGTLNNLAILCWQRKQYGEATLLYERALSISQKALGAEHPDALALAFNLALVYEEQEHYEQAKALYIHILSANEKAKMDQENLVIIMQRLAQIHLRQNEDEQAEKLCKDALEWLKTMQEPEQLQIIFLLQILAQLYIKQDRYQEAIQAVQRVLDIEREEIGEVNSGVANTLELLAQLHLLQGLKSKARRFYEQAWTMYKRTLGEEHSNTVEARKKFTLLS